MNVLHLVAEGSCRMTCRILDWNPKIYYSFIRWYWYLSCSETRIESAWYLQRKDQMFPIWSCICLLRRLLCQHFSLSGIWISGKKGICLLFFASSLVTIFRREHLMQSRILPDAPWLFSFSILLLKFQFFLVWVFKKTWLAKVLSRIETSVLICVWELGS